MISEWQFFEIKYRSALRYDLLTEYDNVDYFKFRNLSHYFYTVVFNDGDFEQIDAFLKHYKKLFSKLEPEIKKDSKAWNYITKLVCFYALNELEDQIESSYEIRKLLRDRPFNVIAETYFETKWNLSDTMNKILEEFFKNEFFNKDS